MPVIVSLHVDTGRHWNGGQNQVRLTVLGLRERGDRAFLAAHPDGDLMTRMREGLDLIPLAVDTGVDMAAAWRLSRALKQTRPQVVHAHDPRAIAVTALALSIVSPEPRPLFVAAWRLETHAAHTSFARWAYAQVDRFVANCAAIRDRLVTDGIPRAKTCVIHEGVDVERITRLPAGNVHGEFYLPTHAPVVGCVAALVPQKGLHHLIDAAALTVREVPDVRFVILGGGELRPSLEKQIQERHLERHVFLAGFRADALELTKAFDIFAISPVSEGMCTALVDAMAAGKPAVATRVGGIPDVVVDGETGFLVEPRDDRALAHRIVQLLKDDVLRIRMGEAALRRVRTHFTAEQMVAATMALYRSDDNGS